MKQLEVKNLSFSYDESTHAVRHVSFAIEKGSYTITTSNNGSGKSTIAKLLIGLLEKDEGEILIDDLPLNEENLMEIRSRVGIVFQNPDNQIIGTVVEEDVGFGPENMGISTGDIWKRVDESLAKTGMTAYRHHSPNKLSGGQKQRVAIAGVMAMRPQCIVLDEPTAMLDPNGRKEVLEAVHQLNRQENVTVVLITHYMEEVIDADRVVVMDDGHVVMEGTPKEIFSQVETLKKYHLDVPQVTLLAHELKQSGVDIPDGILTTEELVNALCQ